MLERFLDRAADRYDAETSAAVAPSGGSIGRFVVALAWVLALIGAVVGAVLLVSAFLAPVPGVQAASAALGSGCAIVPYVLARACQHLHR